MQKPNTAKYLLRFDDICPTMDWQMWSEIEAILQQRQLKPILAVIPDNQDPALRVGPPVEDFWDRVRAWQNRGWPIALHGYQHKYVSPHAGIVATRKKSEFAGLAAPVQKEKLQRARAIFDREGIKASVWIAPGHSFDQTTVSLLPEFGLRIICDGLCWLPFVSNKMVWVPQQMFYFRPAPRGIWTVCYHHNQWDQARLRWFRGEIDRYGNDISSLDKVLQWYGSRESVWSQRFCACPRVLQWVMRCQLKLWSFREAWAGSRTGSMQPPIRQSQSESTVKV